MRLKELIASIFDEEEEETAIVEKSVLLKTIKHFANELIIDLCIRNGCLCSMDLKDVDVELKDNTFTVIIPNYIKEYLKKRIDKTEIIVKLKLD